VRRNVARHEAHFIKTQRFLGDGGKVQVAKMKGIKITTENSNLRMEDMGNSLGAVWKTISRCKSC
jgi:hypothetical protein